MISGPLIRAEHAARELGEAVFLDARAGGDARSNYLAGHVPGALYVDLETDLSRVGDPSVGGRHPLPPFGEWLERVGAWGICRSTPVLIYDADNSGMAAARCWWMLRAIGHQPLAVVDGGWAALERAGVAGETTEPSPEAMPAYPSQVDGWSSINAVEVERLRTDPSWCLVDARAPERYAGDIEPIDPLAGHVPGAINAYWKSYVDERGYFLDPDELHRRFGELLGNTPPERVVCYCGSGVTACHLLLALEAAGLCGSHLYVGSWSEWCRTRAGAI